jgi:hypothetical protein
VGRWRGWRGKHTGRYRAKKNVLRPGEGRVSSRDYAGRDLAPVAEERALGLTGGWLGAGGLGFGGLGVGGFGVGERSVGVEWANSRHRGLSRAMVLHVTKSVGRSLHFSAFLSVRPKFIS